MTLPGCVCGETRCVSDYNKKKMSSQALRVVFLLPAVPHFGKLCDHSPKIFNLQKSCVVWLFLPWIATAEHSLLCQCWDRLIVESNWIQLPRGWGEERSVTASSNLQRVKKTRWELMSRIPTAGPSPGVCSSMGGLACEWDYYFYYCFKADIKSEIVQGLLPTKTKTFAI